ncbi:MAG: trehalose-phosphatase [Gloeomargarita sp. DG02_3_bins_56]
MPLTIAEYWHRGYPLALMLDYDGTLTPIVADPTQAFLPPAGLELLRQVCRHPQIHVAIVSGRSLPQLLHFCRELTAEALILCGLHGGEIYQLPEHRFLRQPEREQLLGQLQPIRDMVLEELNRCNWFDAGVRVEDKTYSIAVHYRHVSPESKPLVIELLQGLFRNHSALCAPFKLQAGKEVLEILPRTFDKGDCVAFLWDFWQVVQGCYIGDDLTDEAAFAVVNQRGGLSIAVGKTPGTTAAQVICPEVADVYRELVALGS